MLYYFAGDQAPGDTNGVGIPEWYPVSPEGEAVGEDESGFSSDPGYDY